MDAEFPGVGNVAAAGCSAATIFKMNTCAARANEYAPAKRASTIRINKDVVMPCVDDARYERPCVNLVFENYL